MRRALSINIMIVLVAVAGLALWCDHRAQILTERAAEQQEKRELDFWRAQLLHFCRSMHIRHNENPA